MKQNTMKALVYHGEKVISLDDVPMPQILKPTDVLIRVTTSTICGSDIHLLNGALDGFAHRGVVAGHEYCGEIIEVGSSINNFKVGDRVVANALIHCGKCFYCLRGEYDHCENMGSDFNPGFTTNGCQAEYIRTPNADLNVHKIPEGLTDEDVLFVGDILSTGYYACEKANIQPGDTVVVIGAGPVGLCAMATAKLWGPAKVIAVDMVQNRLDTAVEKGIANIAINSGKVDALAQIIELTNGRGADVAIEAVGMTPTFTMALNCVRPNGSVSSVGAYGSPMEIDMKSLWDKNLKITSNLVSLKNIPRLIKLIQEGKLDMRFLITHRAPLNDIIRGYDVFGNKKENCLKWLVTPYVR